MNRPASIAITLSLCIVTATAPNVAFSREKQQPRPEIFTRLLDCRALTDGAARLACYDRQVGEMESAAQRDEVVVLDKAELKKTRRSLFGFSFPKLPFLGGADDDGKADPEAARIEAKITSARSIGYGKWTFVLDDGSQWETTEAIANRSPKSGQPIVIKRAAMGSFMGSVNGWPSVRMRRTG